MATLREKLVKIGAKVVSHGRYVTFQLADYLAPPYFHNYDMIALTGALYLILRTKFEAEWTPLSRGIVLLAWFSPLLTIVFNLGGAPIAPLILLALLVLTIIRRYNIGKYPPTCGSRKLLQPCGD